MTHRGGSFLSAALVGLTQKRSRPIARLLRQRWLPARAQAARPDADSQLPKQTIKVPVVIVGGGIAGPQRGMAAG